MNPASGGLKPRAADASPDGSSGWCVVPRILLSERGVVRRREPANADWHELVKRIRSGRYLKPFVVDVNDCGNRPAFAFNDPWRRLSGAASQPVGSEYACRRSSAHVRAADSLKNQRAAWWS